MEPGSADGPPGAGQPLGPVGFGAVRVGARDDPMAKPAEFDAGTWPT